MVYSHEYSAAAVNSPSNTFELDEDDEEPGRDTFMSTAAMQVRQLERERRLREIDRTFQNVVEEADHQIQSASLNFRVGGAAHSEEHIKYMEDTIIASQPKTVAGKIKEKAVNVATQQVNRLTNNNQKQQVEMQSKAAAGNFEDFLPQADFQNVEGTSSSQNNFRGSKISIHVDRPQTPAAKIKDKAVKVASQISSQVSTQVNRLSKKEMKFPFEVRSNTAAASFDNLDGGMGSNRGERNYSNNISHSHIIMINTIIEKCRQEKEKLGLILLAFLMVLGITITVTALQASPSALTVSEETLMNLRLVRGVLISNGFLKKPLQNENSIEFTAAAKLAEEVTLKHISLDSVKKSETLEVNFDETTKKPTSFNIAYVEQRELVERYVLLILYYKTSIMQEWISNDNWLKSGTHVCDGWHGVTCNDIKSGDITFRPISILNLSSNNVTGSIPEEICHLHLLEELNLQDNALSGLVPECLGQELRSLKKIHLGLNSLSGKMPLGLCELKNDYFLEEIISDCGGGGEDDIECDCCTECI